MHSFDGERINSRGLRLKPTYSCARIARIFSHSFFIGDRVRVSIVARKYFLSLPLLRTLKGCVFGVFNFSFPSRSITIADRFNHATSFHLMKNVVFSHASIIP